MAISSIDIATKMLREVGSFSPYDVEPDPSDLAIALEYLDMMLAEKVGTEQLWFFIPETTSSALMIDQGDYYLNDLTEEIELQFVRGIKIVDDTANEHCVELIRKNTYEDIRYDSAFNRTGIPKFAYVERKDNPKVHFLPAPNKEYDAKIWGQTYSNVIASTCTKVNYIGFPDAWELALVIEGASHIGRGPVVDVGTSKLREFERIAIDKWERLMARNSRENVKKARFVTPRDF